uniref:Chromosome 1 open reading frame 43 n=1 Tax=Oncorhynchus kisutch TaxID=8019 RepID=A0A8C7FBX3_ONCKI
MKHGTNILHVAFIFLFSVYLVFVLLFIFVKRQIMRFAMKSRRGPHVPLGHNAPKSSPAVSPWPVHLTVIIPVQQHPLLGHYVVTMVY